MSAKEIAIENIRSISSAGHLDIEDHEVDLQAITSAPLALEDVGQRLTLAQKDLILRRLDLGGLLTYDDLPLTASFMIEKIEKLSIPESLTILKQALVDFEGDVNIPTSEYDLYEELVNSAPILYDESSIDNPVHEKLAENYGSDAHLKDESNIHVKEDSDSSNSVSEDDETYSPYIVVDWALQVRLEAGLIAYHSPYLEVRSVTDPFDDPTIPAETLRAYLLGLIWLCILAFVNEFFTDRLPGISLSTSVASIFTYIFGTFLAKVVPKYKFKIWKLEVDLNPGPWTYKEQVLSTLMFASGGGDSYVSHNITAQKLPIFYGNTWVTKGYQVLLILSSNCMGLGFAGILRKFVIYPSEAVWPTLLPTLAFNKALTTPEKKQNINGWTISKYKFFFIVSGSSFLYFWIPNYLFQALSYFNWMTWIKPDNFNLAVVTGSIGGLGFNPVPTFDWNYIGSSSLATPFYATLNTYFGALLGFVAIIGVYYSNYKWTGNFPVNSNKLFSNKGKSYQIREILNNQTLFDQEKYEVYGPPFYSAANMVTYGAFFALYPFAILHEIAVTYKATWRAIKEIYSSVRHFRRSNYEGFTDPHSVMMRKYKEVPDWAFFTILIISVVFAILAVKLYPANTPVWGIFFALGINLVFLIPITTIYSRTGFSFALNVLVELIVGYALPGNGLALMTIKAFGTQIDSEAQNYITDQKMGHYAKLPPRAMFRFQIIGVFVGGLINMAALNFKLDHIADYCQPHQASKFTCSGSNTFFSASVIWGVIGPKRVFNGLYPILKWTFLIGFLLSFPFIILSLYGPRRYVKFIQPTIIIGGVLSYAPTNLTYLTGGLYASIASMWYLKNKYSAFWSKYNYIFASGMGAGLAFSGFIMFFAVQYHPKDINWWGNAVSFSGIDAGYGQQARLNASLAEGGYVGPRRGHFP